MSVIFVYVTAFSIAEAKKLANAIVSERLAACANIIPGMTSIYRWEGRIEDAEEIVVILKTRADLFQAVEARVRELHSYKTHVSWRCLLTEGISRTWIGLRRKRNPSKAKDGKSCFNSRSLYSVL